MARFLCWLRSSRQTTTIPEGRCVSRTALSVLFWCWPPGPPARMTSVSMSSARIDDVDLLGLGHHGDGRGRGVDPALGLGLRDALDAVAAALELEVAEGAVALDAERDLAEAAQLGRDHVDRLERPALRLGVAPVHLEEVAGEERGLVAAGPGADLDDHARVVGAGGAVVEEVAEGSPTSASWARSASTSSR